MKGFTLIENLIVVAILGFLLIMAVPFQARVRHRYALEMAVWEIHSKMNYLKYQAMKNSNPYRLRIFNFGYIIERYNPSVGWQKIEQRFLSGTWLKANNSPIFYPEGTVSNLASITISNSAGQYLMTLAISGRIKVIRLA